MTLSRPSEMRIAAVPALKPVTDSRGSSKFRFHRVGEELSSKRTSSQYCADGADCGWDWENVVSWQTEV
jgi:hypothetical protein